MSVSRILSEDDVNACVDAGEDGYYALDWGIFSAVSDDAPVEDGSASWRDWSLWHGDEPSGVGFAWPSVGRRVYMERLHAGEETLARGSEERESSGTSPQAG